jgi:hypothetical protein
MVCFIGLFNWFLISKLDKIPGKENNKKLNKIAYLRQDLIDIRYSFLITSENRQTLPVIFI